METIASFLEPRRIVTLPIELNRYEWKRGAIREVRQGEVIHSPY